MQAKLRDVASLEGHVLLKKLRDALESLRGRFTGRNKEDVEKAISMVCYFVPFHGCVHYFVQSLKWYLYFILSDDWKKLNLADY